jgi:hypothetical protein
LIWIEGKEAGINSGHGQSIPYLLHCVIGAPLPATCNSLDTDALDLFVNYFYLSVASLHPLTSYTLSLSLHHVPYRSFTHLLISFSLGLI